MESLIQWFEAIAPLIGQYKYPLLAIITTVEGTWSILVAGVMSSTGILDPRLAFLACLIGEIIDGFLWYGLGHWFGAGIIERFTGKSPVRRALMDRIRHHSRRSAALIILLVKMTYSVTMPTLAFIGSIRYNFKKYIFLNIIGSIGWVSMLFWVSYVAGRPATEYLSTLRIAGLIVIGVPISILLLWGLRHAGEALIRRVGYNGNSK